MVTDDLARAQTAMAAVRLPDRTPAISNGTRLFAQQRHDPADGADEARTVLARSSTWSWESRSEDDAGQRFGQDVDGAPAFHLPGEAVIFAFGRRFDGEVFGLDALLAREAGDGLRRAPISAGPSTRSSESACARAGLRRAEPGGAAWRRASRIRAAMFELLEKQPQIFERGRNHPIGNLFGSDFEQERQAHWAASACRLLVDPGLRDAHRQLAHALNHADAFGDADGAARIERIKQVRALEHLIVSGQQREARFFRRFRIVELQQPRRLRLRAESNSFQSVGMSAISKL